MKFTVSQKGQPLDPSKYTWDKATKTFSSNENNLVLDFSGVDYVTFKTGYGCTFKTGFYCTFTTGKKCVVVRRDVFEVIQLVENQTIKLNECIVPGFTVVDP